MLVIIHDSDDPLARTGARHFAEKYGIPFRIREGGKLKLDYGDAGKEFRLRIRESQVGGTLRRVHWHKGTFPVLEEPKTFRNFDRALAFCAESPCAVLRGNGIELGVDVFREVGYLLTGGMDAEVKRLPCKDAERLLALPLADLLEDFLFELLLLLSSRANLPLVTKPFWPPRYSFAVCLTHDVDEVRKSYQWLTWPLRRAKAGDFAYLKHQLLSLWEKLMGREPFWTFERIMEVERRLGVRSTFYFLQESGKVRLLSPNTWKLYARRYELNRRLARVIRELSEGGWEVGLHGSYYSFENEELLRREKARLEAVLGKEVLGIRQHHGNLSIPLTWELQERAGFAYDTSLLPRGEAGFRWGTCFPFSPWFNGKALGLIEIPTIFMDTPYFMKGPAEAERRCMRLLHAVKRRGGVLNLLFHHTVFNPREFPGWAELYQRLIQKARSMGAWITTAGEVAEWWRRRREWGFEVSFSNSEIMIDLKSSKSQYFKIYNLDLCDNSENLPHNNDIFAVKEDQKLSLKIKRS